MTLRIPNPHDSGEDFAFYEGVYGCVNYENKVVLDIGADVGSTADYFLQKGARCVYAVEGSDKMFARLCENVTTVLGDPQLQRVKPWRAMIRDPDVLAGIIYQTQADVVKFDLDSEGKVWEQELIPGLSDNVLRIPSEWLVECHWRRTFKEVCGKLQAAGFTLIRDVVWAPPNTSVAYFAVLPMLKATVVQKAAEQSWILSARGVLGQT